MLNIRKILVLKSESDASQYADLCNSPYTSTSPLPPPKKYVLVTQKTPYSDFVISLKECR